MLGPHSGSVAEYVGRCTPQVKGFQGGFTTIPTIHPPNFSTGRRIHTSSQSTSAIASRLCSVHLYRREAILVAPSVVYTHTWMGSPKRSCNGALMEYPLPTPPCLWLEQWQTYIESSCSHAEGPQGNMALPMRCDTLPREGPDPLFVEGVIGSTPAAAPCVGVYH